MTTQQPSPASGAAGRPQSSVVAHELAAATATLTTDHDTVGTVTLLLSGCIRAVGAGAAGLVLARPDDQRLELLASTSHRVHELELYQLQLDDGPCVEAVDTSAPVTAHSLEKVAARWPSLAGHFKAAGFHGVHATPLLWHGHALGAINLFFTVEQDHDSEEIAAVSKAFADIATIAIVHAGHISAQTVVAQTRAALSERVVIERAKGVLAYIEMLPQDEAFDRLVSLAERQGRPLREVAAGIVGTATGVPS